MSQQNIAALRRTLYTFRINNGQSVPDVIREVQGAGLNAAAQPDYTYGLIRSRWPSRRISAIRLNTSCRNSARRRPRITEGNDVVIALIDLTGRSRTARTSPAGLSTATMPAAARTAARYARYRHGGRDRLAYRAPRRCAERQDHRDLRLRRHRPRPRRHRPISSAAWITRSRTMPRSSI